MNAKPSIGGQAVLEGVMMRGPRSWAVAVRKPDQTIACETHEIPDSPATNVWFKVPLVRGVFVLAQTLRIGVKALRISAAYALEAEEAVAGRGFGLTLAVTLVAFAAVFIVVPAVVTKIGGRLIGVDSNVAQNLVEGGIRLGFFLAYILLVSLIPDIRRVFQYHGAEHKTIYAYDNQDPMDPKVISKYSTLHVRCGTNFLFIVLFLTIVAHLGLDLALPASIPLRIAARVLAIPVLTGFAYEVIKAAGHNDRSLLFRIVSLPGLALQKITTRPPSSDQIEVAIKAMEAVMAKEGLAET